MSKMALQQVSSVENNAYSETVGNVIINYTANRDSGKPLSRVLAEIYIGGNYIGTSNIYYEGRKDFYIQKGISDEESIAVYQAIVNSSKSIFEELNNKTV